MIAQNDKRIASWLDVSIATFYRWRSAGLLPRRPKTEEEAVAMRSKIDEARNNAAFTRPLGWQGRTKLETVAKILGDQP